MSRYLILKLRAMLASLLVASIVIFAITEIVPGDPASFMLGINAQADTIAALRQELGLDAPIWQRYLGWISGFFTGDLGVSYTYRSPVRDIVLDRLWVSLPLAIYALLLTIIIAVPVGVLAAARRGRVADIIAMGVAQLGVAIPNFWFAMLAVLLFALTFRIFPAGGFPGWSGGLGPALHALTLPAVALALPQASILARVVRSAMIDTLSEDYIRTGRAKGLSLRQTIWRHGVRNAMIPILTIVGLQFSFLLAGAIIIENVFYLPGLGRLVFQAISGRDLVMVQSVVMLLVFAVIFVNFLVDLAYGLIDPRLRPKRG